MTEATTATPYTYPTGKAVRITDAAQLKARNAALKGAWSHAVTETKGAEQGFDAARRMLADARVRQARVVAHTKAANGVGNDKAARILGFDGKGKLTNVMRLLTPLGDRALLAIGAPVTKADRDIEADVWAKDNERSKAGKADKAKDGDKSKDGDKDGDKSGETGNDGNDGDKSGDTPPKASDVLTKANELLATAKMFAASAKADKSPVMTKAEHGRLVAAIAKVGKALQDGGLAADAVPATKAPATKAA